MRYACLLQLYVVCLRVLCNQLKENLDDTCHTLQQAADLDCDRKVAETTYPRPWKQRSQKPLWWFAYGNKVMILADLIQKAGCPSASGA